MSIISRSPDELLKLLLARPAQTGDPIVYGVLLKTPLWTEYDVRTGKPGPSIAIDEKGERYLWLYTHVEIRGLQEPGESWKLLTVQEACQIVLELGLAGLTVNAELEPFTILHGTCELMVDGTVPFREASALVVERIVKVTKILPPPGLGPIFEAHKAHLAQVHFEYGPPVNAMYYEPYPNVMTEIRLRQAWRRQPGLISLSYDDAVLHGAPDRRTRE